MKLGPGSKVLVTGNAGFIGSHLADRLTVLGCTVVGFDNFSTGSIKNVNTQVHQVHGELTELTGIGNDYDAVFHMAALARIQPSIKEPLPAHAVNLTGTLRLLDACRKFKVGKFVFAGSSSIYSDKEYPNKEDGLKDPKSPYAMQKMMAEQYIRLFYDLYGQDYSICRFFNVYGPRQLTDGAYATVIGIFLNQKKNNEKLTIFGKGDKTRDFTYVSDIVDGLILAAEHDGPITMNLGTGNSTSIEQLADLVGHKKSYLPERPGETFKSLADNSVAKSIGWQPKKVLNKETILELENALRN